MLKGAEWWAPLACLHHLLQFIISSHPRLRERWTAMCMPSLSCQDHSDWELTLILFCPRPTTTTTTRRHSASFHHVYDVHQRRIDQSDGGGVEFQQPRPPLSGSSFAFKQKAAFLQGERLSHLVISHLHHNLHYQSAHNDKCEEYIQGIGYICMSKLKGTSPSIVPSNNSLLIILDCILWNSPWNLKRADSSLLVSLLPPEAGLSCFLRLFYGSHVENGLSFSFMLLQQFMGEGQEQFTSCCIHLL